MYVNSNLSIDRLFGMAQSDDIQQETGEGFEKESNTIRGLLNGFLFAVGDSRFDGFLPPAGRRKDFCDAVRLVTGFLFASKGMFSRSEARF